MAKKNATAMHEIASNAGGFGDPRFANPHANENIESAPVEDTSQAGRDFGLSEPEESGRELGM